MHAQTVPKSVEHKDKGVRLVAAVAATATAAAAGGGGNGSAGESRAFIEKRGSSSSSSKKSGSKSSISSSLPNAAAGGGGGGGGFPALLLRLKGWFLNIKVNCEEATISLGTPCEQQQRVGGAGGGGGSIIDVVLAVAKVEKLGVHYSSRDAHFVAQVSSTGFFLCDPEEHIPQDEANDELFFSNYASSSLCSSQSSSSSSSSSSSDDSSGSSNNGKECCGLVNFTSFKAELSLRKLEKPSLTITLGEANFI
jgi:hypothetical protein